MAPQSLVAVALGDEARHTPNVAFSSYESAFDVHKRLDS